MESLEKLNGVGKTTSDKLKKAGYNNIEAIAKAKPESLAKKIGAFSAVAKRIVNSAEEIIEAGIKEEKAIYEPEIKRSEQEEIEKIEEVEEIEKIEEEEKEEGKEKKISKEKQRGKVSLHEGLMPVLVEGLRNDESLFENVFQEIAASVASYIKESAGFREKFLNAAIKNKNFRKKLVNHIAEILVGD